MSEGHSRAVHVLVEDDVAQSLLTELVRRLDPNFLQTLKKSRIGDYGAVRTALRALKHVGVRAAAVLDGDQQSAPQEDIFVLPGSNAPEKELVASAAVKSCVAGLGRNLDDFICSLQDDDHHVWVSKLAENLQMPKEALVYELSKAYIGSVPEAEIDGLIKQLKDAAGT